MNIIGSMLRWTIFEMTRQNTTNKKNKSDSLLKIKINK